MRIRDTNDLAFVLKYQDMIDVWPSSKIHIFALPGSDKFFDLTDFELGQRQIMPRRIANNARDPLGRPVSIDAGPDHRWRGRLQSDAGMIVIKDEDTGILRIDSAA